MQIQALQKQMDKEEMVLWKKQGQANKAHEQFWLWTMQNIYTSSEFPFFVHKINELM